MKKIYLFAAAAALLASCGKTEVPIAASGVTESAAAVLDVEPPVDFYFRMGQNGAGQWVDDLYGGYYFDREFEGFPTLRQDADGVYNYRFPYPGGSLIIYNQEWLWLTEDKIDYRWNLEMKASLQLGTMHAFTFHDVNGNLWEFTVSQSNTTTLMFIYGWEQNSTTWGYDPVMFDHRIPNPFSLLNQKITYSLEYKLPNNLIFSVSNGIKTESIIVNPYNRMDPFRVDVGGGSIFDVYSVDYYGDRNY